MAWSTKSIRRWWRGKSKDRSGAEKRRRRRLRMEILEGRQLLAADCLASIAGVAFTDVTEDGLTGDDVRLSGVTVNLYRDGGDGLFDAGSGDDTLVNSADTDGQGEYRFDDLVEGRYFVEQEPPDGLLQRPGDNVRTVIVSAADALGASGRAIDGFETGQSVNASSTGNLIDALAATAPEALGGERDLFAELTSGMGELALVADAFDAEVLEFMASSTGEGRRVISWDGPDGDALTLDPTGLRQGGSQGVDLTEAGDSVGLELTIGADQNSGLATIRVFTDGGNASFFSLLIPNTGGAATDRLIVRFSDFNTLLGGGADFTNVGAVELEIEGVAAVDGQIDLLGAVQPVVQAANFANLTPMSLGDTVWLENDNSGTREQGEPGIEGVAVNLFFDQDANGSLSPGVDVLLDSTTTNSNGLYQFDGLFPGDYVVQLAESNFGPSGPLENLVSSDGNGTAVDPDDDVDNDDNGDPLSGEGVVSAAVTLEAGVEPQGDNNPTVDFGLVAVADLALSKSDSPDPVGVGNVLTYTLVATNFGPIAATGVTVVDTLPAGVTFQSATATQGAFSETNGVVTFDVGSLDANGSAELTIVVGVDPGTVGPIDNTAQVSAEQFDPDENNNTATESTDVSPRIDLEILKSDDPDPVASGNLLTYTIDVQNSGPSDATGVTVTDMLPLGLTFDSASTTQGTFSFSPDVVTFDLGDMPRNTSATLTIVVEVDPNQRGTVSNTAQVTANETDIDPTNNSSTAETTLEPEVDLVVTKTSDLTTAVAGESLVYTVEVLNQGPSQATSVIVTDTLPGAVAFAGATSTQGTFSHANGVVTANVGTLDPNDSATITITVDVDASASGTLTNVVIADSNESELVEADNQDELQNNVLREIDLVVTKSDSSDPVSFGEQFEYLVQVVNNGPSDASGVVIEDDLPEQLTFISATSTRGGSPVHSQGVVTANVGDLAAGQAVTMTIVVEVNATESVEVVNAVTVTGNEGETNSSNNVAQQATQIELLPSSISGFVYVDSDNDGRIDARESRIPGVTVTLVGATVDGTPVSLTQSTGSNGGYSFDDLLPGTYRVRQSQPTRFRDGRDSIGRPALGMVSNDLFSGIELAAGVDAEQYNFGERPVVVTKLLFLASTNTL